MFETAVASADVYKYLGSFKVFKNFTPSPTGNFSTFNKVCNTTSGKNSTVTIKDSIVQCSIPVQNGLS